MHNTSNLIWFDKNSLFTYEKRLLHEPVLLHDENVYCKKCKIMIALHKEYKVGREKIELCNENFLMLKPTKHGKKVCREETSEAENK